MRVLVTGSEGFLGKNVIVRLKELNIDYYNFTRKNSKNELRSLIEQSDFIIHLAGENRPENNNQFELVNYGLTSSICDEVRSLEKNVPIIFASSSQAELDNSYGKSKLKAEEVIKSLKSDTGINTFIFRLPGVFGKWCKPNYNSVVATFCFNTANNIKLKIIESEKKIELLFVEDLCFQLNDLINRNSYCNYIEIENIYKISVGKLASTIRSFHNDQCHLKLRNSKDPLEMNLLKTYISFISEN